jgi:hypothetical protein
MTMQFETSKGKFALVGCSMVNGEMNVNIPYKLANVKSMTILGTTDFDVFTEKVGISPKDSNLLKELIDFIEKAVSNNNMILHIELI